MIVLALDSGFGDQKWKTDKKKGKFDTAVAVASKSSVEFGDSAKVETYDFNDKTFVVGAEALLHDNTTYSRDVSYIIKYAPLFVAKAIKDSGIKNPDLLVVGLPLGDWISRREELTERLSTFIINKKTYNFEGKILVVPQGVGILTDYKSEHPEEVESESGYVLDVGFNTAIMLRFENGVAKEQGSKQYNEMGISRALEQLQAFVSKNHGIHLSSIEAKDVFLKGFLKAGYGQKIPLKSTIDEIIEEYMEYLINTVQNEYDRHFKTADKLVIAGGGANLIKDHTPEKYKDLIFVPDEPEFANVRGFFIEGLHSLESGD